MTGGYRIEGPGYCAEGQCSRNHGHPCPDAECGYTLLELLVASVPLALVSLLLFSSFAFTIAFSRRGQAEVAAVQQARIALHFMAQELREASDVPRAIMVWSRSEGAARDAVGFLSARVDGPGRAFSTDARGAAVWQGSAYYVHDDTKQELRRVAGDPGLLDTAPFVVGGRLMAKQVSALRVERRGDLITVSLTLKLPSGERVLETTVRPRN